MEKVCLGDGVYYQQVACGFELTTVTTEGGIKVRDLIFVQPETLTKLLRVLQKRYPNMNIRYDK